MHAVFDYSHSKDSLVSVPDFEFVPLAETNPHKYFLWALLRSVSDQSLFSILVIPSKLVAPTTYISLAIVFFMFAIFIQNILMSKFWITLIFGTLWLPQIRLNI